MPRVDATVWKYLVTVLVSVLLTAGGHFLLIGRTVATRDDVKEVVQTETKSTKEKVSSLEKAVEKNREKADEDRKVLIEIKTKIDLVLEGMGIQPSQ